VPDVFPQHLFVTLLEARVAATQYYLAAVFPSLIVVPLQVLAGIVAIK
jgi:hypothetical protein